MKEVREIVTANNNTIISMEGSHFVKMPFAKIHAGLN